MKAKKIEMGMEFYNSHREIKATVVAIDGDKVTVEYEDGTFSNFMDGIKGLKKFIQHTIDKQLTGYEMNVATNTSLDVREAVNSRTTNVQEIFEVLKNHKEDDPDWFGSKNEWFYNLPNQSKGSTGLKTYCIHKENIGCDVEKNERGEYNYGQEKIIQIDDEKYIVRCACKKSDDDRVTFNSIRKEGDWTKMVCMIVMPDCIEMYEADRDSVYLYLEENPNEIGWITKDDWNVVHWHMEYPLPFIFEKI